MIIKLKSSLRPAASFFFLMTVLLGVVYPASVYMLGKIFAPSTINGAVIKDKEGNILGSELIGQNFTKPEYLWGRLSATAEFPYNPNYSGASNLSVNNPKLIEQVKARINALTEYDYENTKSIPVDLVTASGSGLDPHITPATAYYQADRIAKFRKKDVAEVYKIIDKYTDEPILGVFGERTVHVLKVNLALDGKL